MIEKYITVYLAAISLFSAIVCIYDKAVSKFNKVALRVPEKTLFLLSAIGGSAAMYLTMQIFHHKTKHKSFMIGIPVIILLQLAAAVCYFYFIKE